MITRPSNVRSDILSLRWDNNFTRRYNGDFNKAQKVIDQAVLRYNEPFVPRKQGNLIRSGIRSTTLGSGEVTYNTPYARRLYYNPSFKFTDRPKRGAFWFERMKKKYKNVILRTASEVFR